MSTSVLERQKLQVNLDMLNLSTDLAKEAKSRLGYEAGSNLLLQQQSIQQNKETLAKVFDALGIEPFNRATVERYKAAQLKRLNKGIGLWQWANSESAIGSAVILGLVIGVIGLVLNFICNFRPVGANICWWLFPVASFSYFTFVVLAGLGQDRQRFRWDMSNINYYEKPVPHFALSRAIELKKQLPNAEFYVEELKSETLTKDPFLVLKAGGFFCYLDVWDEPTFEGRRTI